MTGYGTWRALAVDCKGVVYVQDAEKIRRWVPPQLCGTRCSDRRRRLIDSGGGYPADDPGAIGSGVLETIIDVTASTLCYDPPCSPTPNYYHIKGLAVDDVGLDDTGGGHSNRYLYYSPVVIPQRNLRIFSIGRLCFSQPWPGFSFPRISMLLCAVS